MNRREALAAGLKYFSTGKPCKFGHDSERYVGNGACVQCLRPKSTSLEVISSPGEIQELQVALIERKLSIQERELEFRIQNKREVQFNRHRQSVIKSKLIEVFVFIDPLDYQTVVNIIWTHAVMREPTLRPEDVVTGKASKDNRFTMRCFPEDKAEIIRFTNDLYERRHVTGEEIARRLLEVQSSLTTQIESESNWPEDDPK